MTTAFCNSCRTGLPTWATVSALPADPSSHLLVWRQSRRDSTTGSPSQACWEVRLFARTAKKGKNAASIASVQRSWCVDVLRSRRIPKNLSLGRRVLPPAHVLAHVPRGARVAFSDVRCGAPAGFGAGLAELGPTNSEDAERRAAFLSLQTLCSSGSTARCMSAQCRSTHVWGGSTACCKVVSQAFNIALMAMARTHTIHNVCSSVTRSAVFLARGCRCRQSLVRVQDESGVSSTLSACHQSLQKPNGACAALFSREQEPLSTACLKEAPSATRVPKQVWEGLGMARRISDGLAPSWHLSSALPGVSWPFGGCVQACLRWIADSCRVGCVWRQLTCFGRIASKSLSA